MDGEKICQKDKNVTILCYLAVEWKELVASKRRAI